MLIFFKTKYSWFWVSILIFGVTVPTSTNPKPNLNKGLYTSASLSNPAAIPIGFGIVFPKISV